MYPFNFDTFYQRFLFFSSFAPLSPRILLLIEIYVNEKWFTENVIIKLVLTFFSFLPFWTVPSFCASPPPTTTFFMYLVSCWRKLLFTRMKSTKNEEISWRMKLFDWSIQKKKKVLKMIFCCVLTTVSLWLCASLQLPEVWKVKNLLFSWWVECEDTKTLSSFPMTSGNDFLCPLFFCGEWKKSFLWFSFLHFIFGAKATFCWMF